MWYLTSDYDHRVLYVVPQKNEIVIGRNTDECNFVNTEDRSISRHHACLKLLNDELYVRDLNSTYGTFINGSTDKLNVGQSVKLNDNDVVKFGRLNWEWKVHKLDLNTCTSTLKGEDLQNVKVILEKLGGSVKNDWDETCLYLTMPVITLTIKVVLALIQGSYIVTLDFWKMCLEAVNNYEKLPKPTNYTPEIMESTLNKEVVSFLPNQNRRIIFKNKKFVFFSKRQFEMYKQVLTTTSAEALLLSESKLTKEMLCNKDVIVIQYNISNTSQNTHAQRNLINEIISYLKNNKKRVVAESEIGLAILYCSTVKYCNPDFDLSKEVIKQTLEKKTSNILAHESQEKKENSQQISIKENIVINESLTSYDACSSSKRKLSDDDIETNANKRLALVTSSTDNESNNKRKFDEDDNIIKDNPNKKIAMDQNVSDSEDYFNFINPVDNEVKETEKKLNLSKPSKRKADFENDDDLFNFIQLNEKHKVICSNTTDNTSEQQECKETSIVKNDDISAMRGIKLQELTKNTNWNNSVQTVNKDLNDLDKKMDKLYLGTTVVKVRKDLIVKRKDIEVKEQCGQSKNFKKFKKVWPLKMHVTVVPKSCDC